MLQDINAVLGREEAVTEIRSMLTERDKRAIFIYGVPGSGKTEFVRRLLADMNYDVVLYDAGDVRNARTIESLVSGNIANVNVLSLMRRDKRYIAVVFDEIESMNNRYKGSVAALGKALKHRSLNKSGEVWMPIVCICNGIHDKKTRELMSVCKTFELQRPTDSQIGIFLSQQMMTPERELLDFIDGDLRRLLFALKIHREHPESLSKDCIHTILEVKRSVKDAKSAAQTLLQGPVSVSEHKNLMNKADRMIVSLLWHENMINVLQAGFTDSRDSISVLLPVLREMCFGDMIDHYFPPGGGDMYSEIGSLMKTVSACAAFHEGIKNKEDSGKRGEGREREKGKGERYNLQPRSVGRPKKEKGGDKKERENGEIRFTKVLTKYSTEHNNLTFLREMTSHFDMERGAMERYLLSLRESKMNIDAICTQTKLTRVNIQRLYRLIDKCSRKETENSDEYEDEF